MQPEATCRRVLKNRVYDMQHTYKLSVKSLLMVFETKFQGSKDQIFSSI